eukprot:2950004-Pyramimonas_sp.AAC.1
MFQAGKEHPPRDATYCSVRLHAGVDPAQSGLWCAAFWGPRGDQTRARETQLPHRVWRSGPMGPASEVTPAKGHPYV